MCVYVFAYIFIKEENSSWYLAADASTARLLNPTKNYFASWMNYLSKRTARHVPSSTNRRNSVSDRVFVDEVSNTFGLGRAVRVILVFCCK